MPIHLWERENLKVRRLMIGPSDGRRNFEFNANVDVTNVDVDVDVDVDRDVDVDGDDVDIVEVVDAHLSYFDAIGAVGPTAPPDDVI